MKTLRLSTPLRGNAALLGKLAMIENPHEVSDRVIPGTHFTIPERHVPNRPGKPSSGSLYLRVVRAESMSPGAKITISGSFPAPDRPQRGARPPCQVKFCGPSRCRRGGRAVECTGLENRRTLTGLVSSNLTLSANRSS